MIHYSFTGTHKGLTGNQADALRDWIVRLTQGEEPITWHHGGCRGGDALFFTILRRLREAGKVSDKVFVEVHPGDMRQRWSYLGLADLVHDVRPYLIRNQVMVTIGSTLIACPHEYKEKLRSGTWATVRYARKRHKPIIIIYPNGQYELEGETPS